MAKTVYFINGFLEGGKTTFISELMKKEYFRIEGSTLLIVCEEGDTDYREEDLKESDTVIEYIEDKENFTEEYITSLEKKHRPERIIVEYNGMWDRKNLEFPWYWEEIVEVAVYDASTFKLYADNMRSILAEQVLTLYSGRKTGIYCLIPMRLFLTILQAMNWILMMRGLRYSVSIPWRGQRYTTERRSVSTQGLISLKPMMTLNSYPADML